MRVLLAQGDPVAAETLAATLRAADHEVIAVAAVEPLTETLRREDVPRVILLDWRLPGCDWREVCCRINHRRQKHNEGWHLIITSETGPPDLATAVLDAGADDHLALPCNPSLLRLRLSLGERLLGLADSLREAWETLSRHSTHDDLTNVWNRPAIMQILAAESGRAQREGTSFGLLMVDLDHFKCVNDTHGHLAGDAVLREVAGRLAAGVRRYDQVGRYGGEEFLVVLPGCGLEEVGPLAERLRLQVLAAPVSTGEVTVNVTVSLGGTAAVDGQASDMKSMIRAADLGLYEAKRAGRNRVSVHPLDAEAGSAGGQVA